MHDASIPGPERRFAVNWAKLNNAVFGSIYADPELRARYERATAAEAESICSDQFDVLANDAEWFVERFIAIDTDKPD